MSSGLTAVSETYSAWQLYKVITTEILPASNPKPKTSSVASTGAYRPSQWSSKAIVKTNIQDDTAAWYFDAIFKEDHSTQLRLTEHPVQTGASITDHAYMTPARVTLEVGMSDCMDSFVADQWGSQNGKSVTAYKQLVAWQKSRTVLTLTTNLNTYQNMVIEQVNVPRDYKSMFSLRATVNLRQIMVGVVATTTVSAIAQTSGTTTGGTSQAQTVDSSSALSKIASGLGIE